MHLQDIELDLAKRTSIFFLCVKRFINFKNRKDKKVNGIPAKYAKKSPEVKNGKICSVNPVP